MQEKHAPGKSVEEKHPSRVEQPGPGITPLLEDQALAAQALQPGGLSVPRILALQRTAGNRSVNQLLGPTPQPEGLHPAELTISPEEADFPVIQRFSAGPHEQISATALSGSGYNAQQMQEIQMGNWATDMNQISLAADFLANHLHFRLTEAEQFMLVRLLAVGEFGEQTASHMSPTRLGSYQAAEHFDNPASSETRPEQQAVASHIAPPPGQDRTPGENPNASGLANIESNFQQAIDAGENSVGLQYYGRAMHTTEDFFAHTNFVRIAMRLLDSNQQPPYGGQVASGPDAGRYRLTSGIFETSDTVMSIIHLIISEIEKPPEPGRITSGDRIVQMFINHISPTLGAGFAAYLRARTAISRGSNAASRAIGAAAEAVIPGLSLYNQAREQVRRILEGCVNSAAAEVGRRVTGTGRQPSHTRMNIDDPASGGKLYPIARELAQHVVRVLDPLMRAAWSAQAGPARITASQTLINRLHDFLVHPDQSDWWHDIVRRGMRG